MSSAFQALAEGSVASSPGLAIVGLWEICRSSLKS